MRTTNNGRSEQESYKRILVCYNDQQDMGRSRGGLTSKFHAVVDTNGLPVHLALTPGEAHDNRLCSILLSALLPKMMLLADRGYHANWIRELARQRTMSALIPTATTICKVVEAARREATSLTSTVIPIPSKVPKMRPSREDRVSCKSSSETITADIASQSASCNPSADGSS